MTNLERTTLPTRTATAQLFIDAFVAPTDANVVAVGRQLTDQVVFQGSVYGRASGKESLLSFLAAPPTYGGFGVSRAQAIREMTWSRAIPAAQFSFPAQVMRKQAVVVEGDDAIIVVSHTVPPRHFVFGFSFDERGRISKVDVGFWMDGATQFSLPARGPVRLSGKLAELMRKGYERFRQIVLAYPTPDGRMHIGLRGSAYVYSEDQIAFWAYGDGGSFAQTVTANPNQEIALYFFDPDTAGGAIYQLYGRGRIVESEAERRAIYDGVHWWEQAHHVDEAGKGVTGKAVIIDIDRVSGMTSSELVLMERER